MVLIGVAMLLVVVGIARGASSSIYLVGCLPYFAFGRRHNDRGTKETVQNPAFVYQT